MTVLPQAPGPEFVFTPPPTWAAPAGFDPRRGHVVDPSWPPAPEGWQFWTLPVVSPSTRLGNGLNKVGKVRIVFGVLAALFLVTRLTGVFGGHPSTGVGSCWKVVDGSKYEVVDCSDSAARYRVTDEKPNPNQCPGGTDSYLDSKDDGDARYKCLVPVS